MSSAVLHNNRRRHHKANHSQRYGYEHYVPSSSSPTTTAYPRPHHPTNHSLTHVSTPSVTITHHRTPPPSSDGESYTDKEKFFLFVNVLLDYTETVDKSLHQQALLVAQECAKKKLRNEPGYESLRASMKPKLRAIVGEEHWSRVMAAVDSFVKDLHDQHHQQETEQENRDPVVNNYSDEHKKEFLSFTEALLDHLEEKDPALYASTTMTIRVWAKRKRTKEPGYESLSAIMEENLRFVVGDVHWNVVKATQPARWATVS